MSERFIEYTGTESVGNVLFWISQYLGWNYGEHSKVESGFVEYGGKIIAEYHWKKLKVPIPVFKFHGEHKKKWTNNQKRMYLRLKKQVFEFHK